MQGTEYAQICHACELEPKRRSTDDAFHLTSPSAVRPAYSWSEPSIALHVTPISRRFTKNALFSVPVRADNG